ncbi:MAG: Rap1a/Tai family immunity protein [Parasphingopyxis sp.]
MLTIRRASIQIALIAIVCVGLPAQPARAQWFAGEGMLADICSVEAQADSPSDVMINESYCLGYIAGVLDMRQSLRERTGLGFCPEGAALGEMHEAVRTQLQEHPESRSYAGVGIVIEALLRQYPECGSDPE